MALITCPECGKEISDRATACPHCGYPIADAEPQPTPSVPVICEEPVPVSPESSESPAPTSLEKKPSGKTDALLGIAVTALIVLSLIGLCIPIIAHLTQRSASTGTPYVQRDFTMTSFPYSMDISGKSVPVDHITFLELYANHGYTGYLVIAIDRRTLSDDEVYWLMKDSSVSIYPRFNWELDTHAALVPHSIENDAESMRFLKCYTTDDYIYHFYCTDLYQDRLVGSFVMASVYYEPDGNFSDRLTYSYNFYFTKENYHNTTSCLTPEEQALFIKATAGK